MRMLAILATRIATALSHSHIDEIWAPNPSTHYQGWNPNFYNITPYPNNTPAWWTSNRGGNPLYPIDLNTYNIICANNSSPANISAPIFAGDTVRVRWWNPGQWPPSHKGPVLSYLASCNGSCNKFDPTALRFVKIAELGWIDDRAEEGYWAADALIDDNSSWNITIPEGLKAGDYVLRTEIIALHLAHFAKPGPWSDVGAEFYPSCISLKVEGNGTAEITGGVDARSLYNGTEPGIAYNSLHITKEHGDYEIPGPPLWNAKNSVIDI